MITALSLTSFLSLAAALQVDAKLATPEESVQEPTAVVASLLESVSDLADRVVRIRTLTDVRFDASADGKVVYDYTYGTGVFVNGEGLIVTAYHLVRNRDKVPEGRREVAVLLRGGRSYLPVDVVAEDPRSDLALLRASPRALTIRKWFAATAAPRPSEGGRSYVLGLRAAAPPENFEIGLIEGRFLNADQRLRALYKGDTEGRGPWIGISQQIFPGYSGGAILDASGALTGIVIGAPELRGQWIDFSFGVSAEMIHRLLASPNAYKGTETPGKAHEP